METINQTLEKVSETLLYALPKEQSLSSGLIYLLNSFSRQWERTLIEVRRCESLSKNLSRTVLFHAPEAKKLADTLWQTFESYGLWSAETESISDTVNKALTPEAFVNEIVHEILTGCECRKGS